jgi:hypothetical protein
MAITPRLSCGCRGIGRAPPTELFERYKRSDQALVLALMEMVVNGVSTRKGEADH